MVYGWGSICATKKKWAKKRGEGLGGLYDMERDWDWELGTEIGTGNHGLGTLLDLGTPAVSHR